MSRNPALHQLPLELIHLIAESLDIASLNNLLRTTPYLHYALTRLLYNRAANHQILLTGTPAVSSLCPVSPFGYPLHYSAFVGNHHAVAKLLEMHVIDVNSSQNGATPLLCAVIGGHAECAGLLMRNGAKDENIWDSYGSPCSALDVAAEYCQESVFAELLRHKPAWKLSFHYVMTGITPREFQPPLKRFPPFRFHEEDDDAEEDAPEKMAAADARFRMAIALLDRGFPLETRCDVGHTPLQCALHRSCPSSTIHRYISPADHTLTSRVVAELLSRGADPNARSNCWQAGGQTPLHQTVAAGDVVLTALILNAGADPMIYDNNDFVPFDIKLKIPILLTVFRCRSDIYPKFVARGGRKIEMMFECSDSGLLRYFKPAFRLAELLLEKGGGPALLEGEEYYFTKDEVKILVDIWREGMKSQ